MHYRSQGTTAKALNQLHVNHIGTEKTKLLVHELVYWVTINTDMENYIKIETEIKTYKAPI